MESKWTRRVFLGSMPFPLFAESVQPGPKRFRDAATEFDVVRYTEPEYNSYLPSSTLRAFAARSGLFLFSSDERGTLQPYAGNWRTAEKRAQFECSALDASTLTFTATDRNVVCFDGPALKMAAVNAARAKVVYEVESGWTRGRAFQVSDLGAACFTEVKNGVTRVRSVNLLRRSLSTVAEFDGDIASLSARPRSHTLLILRAGRAWLNLVNQNEFSELPLAPGSVRQARWTSDGRAVLYLSVPEDPTQLVQLREFNVEGQTDKLIAKTSQYASFAPNRDSSVFAGVSSNRASPYVLLLVRAGRRELTLCEHRATEAGSVRIFFTPNSQRMLFDTDRHGKRMIYGMELEQLVDETAEQ